MALSLQRVADDRHAQIIRQLQLVGPLTAEDEEAIEALPLRVKEFPAKRDISDVSSDYCCVVLSGLACRYQMVAGGRRQIFALHHAGDIPDLQALFLSSPHYQIGALTSCYVAFIAHSDLNALLRDRPKLSAIVHRSGLIEASIYREWIAGLGRRTALERAAHLLCETRVRMEALGLTKGETFALPMTQSDIGDCLGLSTVHVNRVLQELRAQKFIQTGGARVTICDWQRLCHLGDFDPGYLHLRAA